MNAKYALKSRTSTSLGEKIAEICDDYSRGSIDKAELNNTILYYIEAYPDILFENKKVVKTILNIIGKKRSRFLTELEKAQ